MNSISAMLNKHGKGTIYFGVLSNGEVRGQIVSESILRDVSRKIYESIVPQIVPIIEKKNMLWKVDIKDMKRIKNPEIPLKALREMICNSFAHARYNFITEYEITIHPSSFRIYIPGEFPIGLTLEDFIENDIPSMVRNRLILKALFLSDDV